MPKVNLQELSSDALSGYTSACAASNSERRLAHDRQQSSLPEEERTAYEDLSVQEYADEAAETVGLRYKAQDLERQKQENQRLFEDALRYLPPDEKAAIRAKVAAAKEALGE